MPTGRSFKTVVYRLLDGPSVVTPSFTADLTRVLTCGFEEDNLLQTMWDFLQQLVGGTATVQSATLHGGARSLKLDWPASGNARVGRTLAASFNPPFTLRSRWYAYTEVFPIAPTTDIRWFGYAANSTTGSGCGIGVTPAQKLIMFNRASSASVTGLITINPNTWYRVEVEMVTSTPSGGLSTASYTAHLYLGESTTPLETLTLGETLSTGLFNTQFVSLGDSIQAAGRRYRGFFDDFIVQSSGATIAPSRIVLMNPASDVAVAWGRVGAGLTKNYQAIDEVPGTPDDTTTYTQTSSTSAEDRLGLVFPTSVVPAPQAVKSLDLYTRAMAVSGLPTLALKVWDPSGVASVGPTITPSLGFGLLPTDKHLFLIANTMKRLHLDSVNAGYVALSGATEKRITALWANVEI